MSGASDTPGTWGAGIMRHMFQCQCRPYPVNPNKETVAGVKTYPSITAIPDPIDLAVIAINSRNVPQTMQECADKGIKTAVIISAGFSEIGHEGALLEEKVLEIARQNQICYVGPNSMGHANSHRNFSTLAWSGVPPCGPVALISQSGNLGHRILRRGATQGIGFSKFVSTGNETSLHLEDYLEYLQDDPETSIITLYIEGLREARRFFELARGISPKKPIIVIKAGGTKVAARAASSHTGAMAGSDRVYNAVFRQTGIIRVEDDDELCDVVSVMLNQPLPKGNRVGVLSHGGGLGVIMTEACEKADLSVPPLEKHTISQITSLIGDRWSMANPADMAGIHIANNSVTYDVIEAMMEDPNTDAILMQGHLLIGTSLLEQMYEPEEVARFKGEEEAGLMRLQAMIKQHGKPLVYSDMSLEDPPDPGIPERLQKVGLPVFYSPHRAAAALKHLVKYQHYLKSVSG